MAFTNSSMVVYAKLVEFCIDICKRNGKNKLIWFGDKDKMLNYSSKSGEMILTVHRWFANKSCPGNWIRKGPGTDYGRVQFCPVGVYTIMEVKAGQGSKAGWGRLKSGIGWLSLDFCQRL